MRDTALTHVSDSVKVLHVTTLSKINCGAAVSLLQTVDSLAGHINQAVFVAVEGEVSRALRNLGIEVHTAIPSPPDKPYVRGKGAFLTLKGYLQTLLKTRPDLIHLASAESLKFVGWASLASRVPTVAHQRETYRRRWQVRGLSRARRIIAISEYVRSSLPASLQQQADVVYNPVKIPEHVSTVPRESKRPLRIVYIGRYHLEKGPDILLSAFQQLPCSFQAELILVGDNPTSNQPECQKRMADLLVSASQQVKDRVNFVSWQEDIESWLTEADIVAIPSRVKEGLGRVALEAMAHGIPVIAANQGGLSEIIDHERTGLLFKPNNTADLSSKFMQLAQAPDLRAELAVQGRRHILENFSTAVFRERLMTSYAKVLQQY